MANMGMTRTRLILQICFALVLGHAAVGFAYQGELVSDSTDVAIDFKATDLQGKPFSGLSLQGKTVLLDIWAVWCAPCFAAFPTLKKIQHEFETEAFEVVGIAVYSGTAEAITEVVEKHDLKYRILVGDEDLVEHFDVIGVPTYVLVGPDGNIYKKYVGTTDGFYQELREDIVKLIGDG